MKFRSTRGKAPVIDIAQALLAGLAPDGGLYVPDEFPRLSASDFKKELTGGTRLAAIGARLLAPFFATDPGLSRALPGICTRAFDFPVPLRPVAGREGDYVLELFHGPTAAFKDVGARFLAECVSLLKETPAANVGRVGAPLAEGATPVPGSRAANVGSVQSRLRRVIVATSGDTGGAVAAAFFGKPGLEVVVLYPKGRISARQEKQLCAWGGNIRAFAVEGSFDDCQRMVKEALLRPRSATAPAWLSANSINLGRILPQMVYYAYS